MSLHYVVEKSELSQKTKWVSKVLGNDYEGYKGEGSREVQRDFLEELTPMFLKVIRDTMSMEDFNRELRRKVEEWEVQHPTLFTFKDKHHGMGWWELKTLSRLYGEGRVVLDGVTSETMVADQQKLRLQSVERLTARQELKALEEQERREQEAEDLRARDAARLPVIVGTKFSSKADLFLAYKELIHEAVGNTTQVAKLRELDKCVTVEKVKGGWEVTEVLKEGGRKW